MNVKTILKDACDFIGLEDIKTAITNNSATTTQQAIIDRLLRYFNVVQNEIATEFIPLLCTENISATDSLNFSSLTKTILDVKSLKNVEKERMSFKIYPDKICFDGKATEITYSYIPADFVITDSVTYPIPSRLYAYGIAREYYIDEQFTDKATMFEDRFKNGLSSMVAKKLIINMPARKWL